MVEGGEMNTYNEVLRAVGFAGLVDMIIGYIAIIYSESVICSNYGGVPDYGAILVISFGSAAFLLGVGLFLFSLFWVRDI
jgi:hypothetical protein